MDSAELLKQFLQLQQQLAEVEKSLIFIQNRPLVKYQCPCQSSGRKVLPKAKKDTLSYHVAHDVSSVVGLKEAITWKSKFLKCVWTMALCAGVGATAYFVYSSWNEYMDNPTATRTEYLCKSRYYYPPILLCPNAWLDADKALSLGLSLESLKYSLGYVNYYKDKLAPDNKTVVVSRKEFFSFFDKSNFTSFDDYLIKISADIPLEHSQEKYDSTFNSSAYCPRCDGSFLPKVVTINGVCYKYQMRAENGRALLMYVARQISMQINDRSRGLINTFLWGFYLGSVKDLSLKNPAVPRINIKAFAFTKIRFQKQNLHMEPKANFRCLPEEEIEENYSSTACITKCSSQIYSKMFNCTPFESTIEKFEDHPSQLCNDFDKETSHKYLEPMEDKTESVLNSDEAKKCYERCPYTCDRTNYAMTQEGQLSSSDHSAEWVEDIEKARRLNTTFVDVFIENSALYEGGVITLWEVNTISFTSLISNVGGALGLFVGATMMTLVQIVMFVVRVLFEKQNRNRCFNKMG